MRAYWVYFRLNMVTGLQYRIAAYAGIVTQFFFGFVFLMIFEAFYASGRGGTDFSFAQMVSYMWLQQAFLALILSWYKDNELFSLITSGNLVYELCRPIDMYWFWYAKLLAKRFSSAALRFIPVLLVAAMLPEPYRLAGPASATSLLLFVFSLLMGVFLLVSLSMFVYLMTMKTMSSSGCLILFALITDFLSGCVIPIPLMPDGFRRIVEYLPFRYTADFPFRVYSGHINLTNALWGIGIQGLWLLLLISLGSAWMRHRLKCVTVQGG